MGEKVQVAAKQPKVKRENLASHSRNAVQSQSMSSPIERILFLQRTIGNQAVQRLIKSGTMQAKVRIGKPGDKYEQQADRVADAVMQMPEPGVQRQVEPEEEEETLQTKPLANQITPLVQVQRQEETEEEDEETLQAKPLAKEITPLVQRQVDPEEEEEELQAKTTSGRIPEVQPNIESRIHSLKGGGQSLSENDRTFFEPRFGHDFSQVRVHTNLHSANTAQAINSKAFTVGRDVVFGVGQYSPETSSGKRLLAHELTHVVQQRQEHSRSNLVVRRQPAFTTFARRNIPFYSTATGRQIIGNLSRGRRVRILGQGRRRHRVRVMVGPLRNREGYIRARNLIILTATSLNLPRPVRLVFFQNPERIGTTVLTIGVGLTRSATSLRERTPQGRFVVPRRRRCRIPEGGSVYLYSGSHPSGYYYVWRPLDSRRCDGYIPRSLVRTDISHRRSQRNYFLDLGLRYARRHPSIFVDPVGQHCMDRRYPVEYYNSRDILRGIVAAHNCTNALVREIHIVSHGGTHGIPGTGDFQHMYGIYLRRLASQVTSGGLTTRQFARQARRLLHNNVRIVIHACHTAEPSGFAQELATELRNVSLTGAKVRGLRGAGPAGRQGPFYVYPGGNIARD